MKYAVRYEEEVLNQTTPDLDAKKCTGITFENYGDDNVIINRAIKLNAGTSLTFENLPNEIIYQNFKVQFENIGINPYVLIIRKYVTPINL
jgi:hypothetical protein